MNLVEKVFYNTQTNEKTIEKVIIDDNVHYLHLVFPKGDGLPIHQSNANMYMTVIRGLLSIGLNNNDTQIYTKGTVLNIPCNTTMNVRNEDEDILELIIVKTPVPGKSCV
ncbi:MAG: cupin domain-containing protein [Erysipelotrichales bacterium]|jgi:quercetin dioxygenase-like cupin family protein|nr:cupin domain-containing protein [Erysipelotrichales bacterium]